MLVVVLCCDDGGVQSLLVLIVVLCQGVGVKRPLLVLVAVLFCGVEGVRPLLMVVLCGDIDGGKPASAAVVVQCAALMVCRCHRWFCMRH